MKPPLLPCISLILVLSGCGSSDSMRDAHASAAVSRTAAPTGALSIAVQGSHLVNGSGQPVQLRGVNVAGNTQSTGAPNMWDWSNLTSGNGSSPDWGAIKAWKVNSVRYCISEASWQGRTTVDYNGARINNDPNHNYVATVKKDVAAINALGMYVILVEYDSAPGDRTPTKQNPMINSDNSLGFWSSVANAFKDNPAVLFEIFNEPFLGAPGDGVNPKAFKALPKGANYYIRNGGAAASYYFGNVGGTNTPVPYEWTTAGYQQALDAIRATGATNVVVMGGQAYDNDDSWWTSDPPSDPLGQIAITYHAYQTNYGYSLVQNTPQHRAAESVAMLTKPGVPVIITELGGPVGPEADTTFMTSMLNLIDAHGWGVLAWTWNPWNGSGKGSATLIQDAVKYAPTVGEGQIYNNWTLNHP
jgi:endoglucanase